MEETINLSAVLDQVCAEKNISKDILVETVEQAVATAAKKVFEDREIEASFDPETGHVNLFQVLYVVDEVQSANREISLDQAQRAGLEAEVGDELLFQIFYLESDRKRAEQQAKDYAEIDALQFAQKGFGRIAAQTAKQVIIQRVREAERENLYDRYKDKKGELMTGIVRRFERGSIVVEVDNGRAEAILPSRDQVPRESLRPGDRIDLLATVQRDKQHLTMPLLQGVRVLATGSRTRPGEDVGAGDPLGGTFGTLTLDLSEEEATRLVAARALARLTAVLRNPQDIRTAPLLRTDALALLGLAPAPTAGGVPVIYGGVENPALIPTSSPLSRPAPRAEPAHDPD